ncbi:hypothetical protein [Archangium sp. Cb G35]|uniref:c-type cytochrome n=1 Tax=Archangium sp. Cb G35 TaxID=1920190 RepID=UPI000B1A8199|nr:hypothetical protein [Archangium sp. Cb G35]
MAREPSKQKRGDELGVLEDLTPVQREDRNRRVWALLAVGAAALVLLGWTLYQELTSNEPVRYAADEEHFKYGSIGSDAANGIPYYVWKVMPELCADKLPRPGGGYESLGFMFEPGRDLPVGTSKRKVIVDRVGFNCAFCHAGSVRTAPGSERQLYVGMPANGFDLRAYVDFFSDCARDPRFTPETVMAFIDQRYSLGWVERLLYRYVVVDATRRGLLEQAAKMQFMREQPDWGPGRVDTFNPYKTLQFNFDVRGDDSIGTTDFPAIWNQAPRDGMDLHWDGNNSNVHERNMSAALGAGVTPPTLDCESINRLEQWLNGLPAPRYPFQVDAALAAQGKDIFGQQCADCHAFGGERTGKVTSVEEVQTDRHRLDAFSYELLSNFNTLYTGYAGDAGQKECRRVFSNFTKTNGYANHPLDGIWLRAPYLHNGSVPSLMDLLEPPAQRPTTFYRGNDVYDPVHVGFVSDVGSENGHPFFTFDTREPGNSNAGHLYGTDLLPEQKRALVEFMKTL